MRLALGDSAAAGGVSRVPAARDSLSRIAALSGLVGRQKEAPGTRPRQGVPPAHFFKPGPPMEARTPQGGLDGRFDHDRTVFQQ
jgi:hypothetical protein